jgi:hypothetical protein
MRRSITSLLLALFLYSLASPVVGAHSKPELPACCRRNGTHHCAMQPAPGESAGQFFAARCSQFPGAPATPAHANQFADVPASRFQPVAAPVFLTSGDCLEAPTVDLGGLPQKRGPPSTLNPNNL